MIFKRVVPVEYYLFSSDGYALAVGWLLLWQWTTQLTWTLVSSILRQQWAFTQQQILY